MSHDNSSGSTKVAGPTSTTLPAALATSPVSHSLSNLELANFNSVHTSIGEHNLLPTSTAGINPHALDGHPPAQQAVRSHQELPPPTLGTALSSSDPLALLSAQQPWSASPTASSGRLPYTHKGEHFSNSAISTQLGVSGLQQHERVEKIGWPTPNQEHLSNEDKREHHTGISSGSRPEQQHRLADGLPEPSPAPYTPQTLPAAEAAQGDECRQDDDDDDEDDDEMGGGDMDMDGGHGERSGGLDMGMEDDGPDTGGVDGDGSKSAQRRGKGWRKGIKGKLFKGCKAPGSGEGGGMEAAEELGTAPGSVSRPMMGSEVEECCAAGCTAILPTELFRLPGLGCVLNLESWNSCLSEEERQELRQLLPPGMDERPGGELEELLMGEVPLHFTNPTARLWRDMVEGECHPRVVKYRLGVQLLHEKEHHHNVREYHNNLVRRLMDMSAVFASMPGADMTDKLSTWAAITSGGGPSAALPGAAAAAEAPPVRRRRRRNSKGELVDPPEGAPIRRSASRGRRAAGTPRSTGGQRGGIPATGAQAPVALSQALQALAALDDDQPPPAASGVVDDDVRRGGHSRAAAASMGRPHLTADDEETESLEEGEEEGVEEVTRRRDELEEDVDILGGRMVDFDDVSGPEGASQ